MTDTHRRFVVERVPSGALTADCFRLEEAPVPAPKEGEVLLRSLYVSLDAANRAWMQGATYRAAVEPGSVTAAGAVGNVVGQIGKIVGCRVVGIAGGEAKCRWLTEELGFDATVDYKAGRLHKSLKAACPQGIDVYFDNVGGDVFEAVLFQMRQRGRIACCGAVSGYDSAPAEHGPRGVPGMIVVKRLSVRGFIVMDFFVRRAEALAQLQAWVRDGRIKVVEDVIDGFENLPQALIGLLRGENRGKRMVRVG